MTGSLEPLPVNIYSVDATSQHSNRVASGVGKEIWQIKLGDFDAAGMLVNCDKGVILIQTREQLIAVSAANGTLLWKQQAHDIRCAILAPNDMILHIQEGHLVSRSLVNGTIQNQAKLIVNPSFTPQITTNNLVVIQEIKGDQTSLSALDLNLNKVWEIPLEKLSGSCPATILKNGIAVVSQEGVSAYSLTGEKLWSRSFSEMGGKVPNLVVKLSDDTILLHSHDLKVPSLVLSVSTGQVKQVRLPHKITHTPLVLQKPTGEFELFYQTQAKDLGFGNKQYQLVMVDQLGNKRWEHTSQIQPRSMIADQKGTLFIAFSPTAEQFKLYGSYHDKSPCFIKNLDADGKEISSFSPPGLGPILSPLCISPEGKLLFVDNGTLHALN